MFFPAWTFAFSANSENAASFFLNFPFYVLYFEMLERGRLAEMT